MKILETFDTRNSIFERIKHIEIVGRVEKYFNFIENESNNFSLPATYILPTDTIFEIVNELEIILLVILDSLFNVQ